MTYFTKGVVLAILHIYSLSQRIKASKQGIKSVENLQTNF